jgi:hypothetical protein
MFAKRVSMKNIQILYKKLNQLAITHGYRYKTKIRHASKLYSLWPSKKIVDKWLRSISLIALLFGFQQAVFAECDAELKIWASSLASHIGADSARERSMRDRHAQALNYTASANLSMADRKSAIERERRGIKELERQINDESALLSRARGSSMKIGIQSNIDDNKYHICMANMRIARIQSANNIDSAAEQGNTTIHSNSKNQNDNNQADQQQAYQAQQAAQQSQARTDQQRQGKRKTNDPAAQAHNCIEIDKAGSGNFGAFKNTCNFKVNFTTCNYKPRVIQGGFNWSADFNCEKQQYGLHTPGPGQSVAAHNRTTEMVYWFACKAPAGPVDAEFVVGKGIEARCHN